MALSYKQQLVFTDDRNNSVTVNIGDVIRIKGHEYIHHKDVEIRGKVEDFDLGGENEIVIINEITNEEYYFHLNQIEKIQKLYWTPKMIKGITEKIQSKYPNMKLHFKDSKDWMTILWECDDKDKEDLTDNEFNDFTMAVSEFLSREDMMKKLCIGKED